jgi:5-methyltetrahydrofolate--homocysteine methyltransferase
MMADVQDLYEAILAGKAPEAKAIAEQALGEGADPEALVNERMIPAMDEVGRRFEANEYFVPELLIAARAMKQALEIVRPRLAQKGIEAIGRVAVGTVKGDLHDIGKNLVASMLEGGGFEIIDLGVDVGPEQFVQAVQDQGAKIVALSALLTTTMPSMKSTIDALAEAGLRDQVKVMIGGAPITRQYAEEIGADAYSDNAAGAVNVARELVSA